MMRPTEDKSCHNYGSAHENLSSSSSSGSSGNSSNFEFYKGGGDGGANRGSQRRKVLGASRAKPTPSKWDDAQKWLVGLSGRVDPGQTKSKPRNSNADDRRLLNSASQRGRDSCSSVDGLGAADEDVRLAVGLQDEAETKNIDGNESLWRIHKPTEDSPLAVRSVCVRDMGTEMTPIASQEPSRAGTPLRATTPALRSPVSSRSSTPGKNRAGSQPVSTSSYQAGTRNLERKNEAAGTLDDGVNGNGWSSRGGGGGGGAEGCKIFFDNNGTSEQQKGTTSLESRATAWDEAERTKYMARYKREEVKIQAWENHEKRKAEMEMRKKEVRAERVKSRAQERLTNKLAATRRIAEEKRANAEAKLNERAAKTSERADYIRRTGHLPSSFFSFKLPSLCG